MAGNEALHLIYVHGFQGDHTTFQSFPTDVHNYVVPKLPNLQTHIYPTYKSSRPLQLAAQNFLVWLATLAPGPVILAGHSMGGLLVAEAATDKRSPQSKRIIGVLAFDTPFLGMHPHVIISGIASLFNKKEGEQIHGKKSDNDGLQTESDVNDTNQVNLVNRSDAYPHPLGVSPSPSPSPSRPSSPKPSFFDSAFQLFHKAAEDPMVKFITKHSDDPLGAIKDSITHYFEFGICMFDPQGLTQRYADLEAWHGSWANLWTETVSKPRPGTPVSAAQSPRSSPAPTPIPTNDFDREMAKALRKHERAKEKEKFKAEEKARKKAIGEWKEREKERKKRAEEHAEARRKELELAKAEGREPLPSPEPEPEPEPEPKWSPDGSLELPKSAPSWTTPHHFINLPNSSLHKWIKVEILGVDDEVQAHCGLFLRHQNLDYDDLVRRVGDIVVQWAAK